MAGVAGAGGAVPREELGALGSAEADAPAPRAQLLDPNALSSVPVRLSVLPVQEDSHAGRPVVVLGPAASWPPPAAPAPEAAGRGGGLEDAGAPMPTGASSAASHGGLAAPSDTLGGEAPEAGPSASLPARRGARDGAGPGHGAPRQEPGGHHQDARAEVGAAHAGSVEQSPAGPGAKAAGAEGRGADEPSMGLASALRPAAGRGPAGALPAPLPPRPGGPVSVLCVDGGGIRDTIPTQLCCHLERILQRKTGDPRVRLADFFDLMAGTSGGGLLTLMLTAPDSRGRPAVTAQQVADFWVEQGPRIFRRRHVPKWVTAVRNIWRPKYKVENLERLLEVFLREHCGAEADLRLSQAVRPVLVTSYDILNSAPYFFTREHALADPGAHDYALRDVCRATSAAPTIFKPALLRSLGGERTMVCVDGGLVANNPSVAAFLHVLNNRADFPLPPPPHLHDMGVAPPHRARHGLGSLGTSSLRALGHWLGRLDRKRQEGAAGARALLGRGQHRGQQETGQQRGQQETGQQRGWRAGSREQSEAGSDALGVSHVASSPGPGSEGASREEQAQETGPDSLSAVLAPLACPSGGSQADLAEGGGHVAGVLGQVANVIRLAEEHKGDAGHEAAAAVAALAVAGAGAVEEALAREQQGSRRVLVAPDEGALGPLAPRAEEMPVLPAPFPPPGPDATRGLQSQGVIGGMAAGAGPGEESLGQVAAKPASSAASADNLSLCRLTCKDVLVLSLGAGEHIPSYTYDEAKKWGLLGWAEPLVDVMVWGGGNMVHSQMCLLYQAENCHDNYVRIEISKLPKISTRMDNAVRENVETLIQLAQDALGDKGLRVRSLVGDVAETEKTNGQLLEALADKLVAEYFARKAHHGHTD